MEAFEKGLLFAFYIKKLIMFSVIGIFKIVAVTALLYGQIYTNFSSPNKAVVFTFDACETKTPAYFDKQLVNFIIENQIPVTLFLSGKFIERNKEDVKSISKHSFIEIENHSYLHSDFKTLKDSDVVEDVQKNQQLIQEITGRRPTFFRFPYGEYTRKNLEVIERLGLKVVHWTFPSGDPDKNLTKSQLIAGVVDRTRSGDILIFHINGRGWKTKEAFPEIVDILKKKGYNFYPLKDVELLTQN